jgi:hypothetical protein
MTCNSFSVCVPRFEEDFAELPDRASRSLFSGTIWKAAAAPQQPAYSSGYSKLRDLIEPLGKEVIGLYEFLFFYQAIYQLHFIHHYHSSILDRCYAVQCPNTT